MINVGATVEDDFLDAGLLGTLGNQLANCGRSCRVGTGLEVLADGFSSVEAEATVTPLASSMTCTEMFLCERVYRQPRTAVVTATFSSLRTALAARA
jgi:hypothetical protein